MLRVDDGELAQILNTLQPLLLNLSNIIVEVERFLLGGLDVALKTLLVFILLDYITGVCEAITKKKLNSIIGAKGIVKKIGYLIIVALSVQLDRITGETGAIRTLVSIFL